MKRISILFSSAFWIGTTLTSMLTFDTAPAKAEPSCGSGSSAYLASIITPIASRQFKVACIEHDVCYDTLGKSKQECDRAFLDRMRGICAYDHNTILGTPLRIACNTRADIYYAAVRKYAGNAYSNSQASACRNNSTQIRPTTGNIEFRRGQEWNTRSNYKFIFQNDGNLVLYNPAGSPIWDTGTNNRADLLAVQADGNTVLYGNSGVVWSAGTGGIPGAFLAICDSSVAVYGRNDSLLWSSNTFGH